MPNFSTAAPPVLSSSKCRHPCHVYKYTKYKCSQEVGYLLIVCFKVYIMPTSVIMLFSIVTPVLLCVCLASGIPPGAIRDWPGVPGCKGILGARADMYAQARR